MTRWLYEPDENPKRKHRWKENRPGFVEVDGVIVGKCPANIEIADAERMLNAGVPYFNPRFEPGDYPDRIYVVYEGAVYRAMPTRPGVSYHAFPALGRNLRGLPKALRDAILVLAEQQGCRGAVEDWIDQ